MNVSIGGIFYYVWYYESAASIHSQRTFILVVGLSDNYKVFY